MAATALDDVRYKATPSQLLVSGLSPFKLTCGRAVIATIMAAASLQSSTVEG